MQETWVWSLVQEDPRCHRATQPVHHSSWSPSPLEPASHERSLCTQTGESHLLTMTRESPHSTVKTQHSQDKPQHTYATAHQESKRRKEHFTLEGFSVSLLLPTLQHMYPFPLIESFKVGAGKENVQTLKCQSAPTPPPTSPHPGPWECNGPWKGVIASEQGQKYWFPNPSTDTRAVQRQPNSWDVLPCPGAWIQVLG